MRVIFETDDGTQVRMFEIDQEVAEHLRVLLWDSMQPFNPSDDRDQREAPPIPDHAPGDHEAEEFARTLERVVRLVAHGREQEAEQEAA